MEEKKVNPSRLQLASPVDSHDSTPPPAVTTANPVPHATSNDSATQVASINPIAPSSPAALTSATTQDDAGGLEAPSSMFSTSGLSSWAKNLKISQPSSGQESPTGKKTFSRLTSGLGLRLSPKDPQQDESAVGSTTSTTAQAGVFGSLTKGIVDSSKNAVKAVQVKARHMVSQNKRRYQVHFFFEKTILGTFVCACCLNLPYFLCS
jgi:phosphatidylinositol-3,4,5-trisphosphate 3-phosphatase/dual-specificity protein phosphatase PTEN